MKMYLDLNTNILVNKEQNTMEKKKKAFLYGVPVLTSLAGKRR